MAVKRTGQMSFVEAFIGGKIGGSSSGWTGLPGW